MEEETDDDNLPEFFKVYIPHLTLHQMLIPKEFVDHMGPRKSGLAQLAGPSGQTWPVELVQVGQDLYFTHGWQIFVKDNFVRDGDFLFFKLHADLLFTVTIYDGSMCVRGMEFFRQRRGVDKTAEPTAVSVKPSFERPARLLGVNFPKSFLLEHSLSYRNREKMVLRTSKNSCCETTIIVSHGMTSLSSGWRAFLHENHIREGDICKFELLDRLEMMVHVANREEQNRQKKVDAAASKINSSKREMEICCQRRDVDKTAEPTAISVKPSFERPVRLSGVNFPKSFLLEHSLSYRNREKMVLRTSKNSYWEITIIVSHGKTSLSSGWRAFFRENHIREGDICKFKLLDRLEMMVHVANREEGNRQKKVDAVASKINSSKRAAEISQPSLKRCK